MDRWQRFAFAEYSAVISEIGYRLITAVVRRRSTDSLTITLYLLSIEFDIRNYCMPFVRRRVSLRAHKTNSRILLDSKRVTLWRGLLNLVKFKSVYSLQRFKIYLARDTALFIIFLGSLSSLLLFYCVQIILHIFIRFFWRVSERCYFLRFFVSFCFVFLSSFIRTLFDDESSFLSEIILLRLCHGSIKWRSIYFILFLKRESRV